MQKRLSAFTLMELLVASLVSTSLFLASMTVLRSYNQLLARSFALVQLRGQQRIVENFVTRIVNNAGYENLENNLGQHIGCYLSVKPTQISAAYDTIAGGRERVDLDVLALNGLYRGFDAGNNILEFNIYDWNSSSNQFVIRSQWVGPLVDQVERFFVTASPSACNPELIVVGVLLRSREPIFRSATSQSFQSEYFSMPSVSSTHMFAYNEFLVAPKNVVLR